MKCKEIFDSALALLDELSNDPDNEDLRERMPYLMALFCGEVLSAIEPFGVLSGGSAAEVFSRGMIDGGEDFPLDGRFAASAAYYLAAMLVSDYDQQLFENLFERYTDMISRAIDGVGASPEPIRDVYEA